MKNRKLKFVDLFAGVGGIRLGLEEVLRKNSIDFECVFSCEIHPKAQETYALNYGDVPHSDIRQVKSLPPHDVLLAGFPCQAFSYAGKQKGFADTRGTLFFEIERLLGVAKKKPKYLLLENVRGFTTHDKGRTFETVIHHLDQLGYKVKPILLNSSNFNVPQNRVRIYLVCKLKDEPVISIQSDVGHSDSHKFKKSKIQIDIFEELDNKFKTVKDILEPLVDEKYLCSDTFTQQLKVALDGESFNKLHGVRLIDYRGGNSIHSWDLGLKGHCSKDERDFMDALISNRRKKEFGDHQDGKRLNLEQIKTFWDRSNIKKLITSLLKKGYLSEENGTYNPVAGNMSFEVFKFLDPDSISITVVSSDANKLGVVSNDVPRRITPRECARLQGFPDSFKLHPNDGWAYHQLGNSVSVPVISAVFDDVVKHNEDFLKPFRML
jgi:DNA (cytosine-5)-methyltransferase 1